MAVLAVAIVSLVASMGPPGSANEIAIPATIGARTTRAHSSSVKSSLVLNVCPSALARPADVMLLSLGPISVTGAATASPPSDHGAVGGQAAGVGWPGTPGQVSRASSTLCAKSAR